MADPGRRWSPGREGWSDVESTTHPDPALPPWARAADYLTIALAIIGITVSASGGFRLRVGEWRFALTSLARPLLIALAVTAVRHAFLRQPPIYLRAARQAQRWWRSPGLRIAASVFTGSRAPVFLVGLLAVLMFGYPPGAPPWRDYDNELVNLPLRWDAGWYLQIAENGYSYSPRGGAEAQQNIVFFPAYPVATRVLALLLGNQKPSYVAAGTIVSLAAFLLALVYLYAFARDEIGEERAAVALWLMAAYPFALFFGALYTESLYLLAALGAFHHFRRQEYWRAGLWGLVIGLTRPNGGFLSVPLGLLAISPWLPAAIAGGGAAIRSQLAQPSRQVATALAAASMGGIGTLLYSAYIWQMTGSPFAWASGHAAWGRHYGSLTQLVASRYQVIGNAGLYEYVSRSPYDLLNVLGAAFVLASVWPVWRRFGIAFAAFILVNIVPPLTTGGFLSAGRLSSVLFPAFVWLAAVISPRQRTAWIVSFAMLQAICAALFYTWRPLF